MTPELTRLKQISQRLEQAPTNWRETYYGNECFLEAIDPCSMAADPQPEKYAIIDACEQGTIQLLSNAHDDLTFVLEELRRAWRKIRSLEASVTPPPSHENSPSSAPDTGKPKDYAAECAMKCQTPAFKRFLKMQHGLISATDENTAAKVRELIGISSRKILNEDSEKAARWRRLVGDFEGWMRHG